VICFPVLKLLWLLLPLSASAVILSWDVAPGASGYCIFWGPDSRYYTNFVRTDQTQLKLALQPGVYHLAVTATNQQWESAFSTELVYTQSLVIIPIYLESAPAVDGPYTVRTNWTFTEPIVSNQFYRVKLEIGR
jgi:hypothetical protein